MKEIKLYGFTKITCYGNEEYDYEAWFGNSVDHFNTIRDMVENDEYSTGLEEYIYDEDLKEKVKSIKITVILKNGKIYSEATIAVTDDFNEDGKDMENLKWYIEGQYSDGWGEGFEQHEFDDFWEEEETEYWDDEEEEYVQDYEDVHYFLYFHFYVSDKSDLMTEEEFNKMF